MSKVAFAISAVLLGSLAHAQTVTTGALLKQMYDLDWLTRRPSPYFKMAQASSYDRASTTPADPKTWFANGDAGQFVTTTTHDGITEYVMADLKGPGTVVRLWSANPAGRLRFYFDGETTPRFTAMTADLLNGRVAPFGNPFSYPTSEAANGANLYFPFPYAKSLKITVDSSAGGGAKSMYYHVGYRTYATGTRVETFDPTRLSGIQREIDNVKTALSGPPRLGGTAAVAVKATGSFHEHLKAKDGAVLRMLSVRIPFPLVETFRKMDWNDPHQAHNVLRNSTIKIVCDGEPTVVAPLGDFFGAAPGINQFHSYPFTVAKDGTMTCYWPMPFKRSMEISIETPKGLNVPLEVSYEWEGRPWTNDTYYFHAHWNIDLGPTRPMRDMEFLSAEGEGFWVGSNLHVTNPVGDWWGEGDEKAWVDGESFPSTFGTGSEDYYGYAWSSNLLFDKPYHGQARCDGPATYGHVSVHRWQIFDPISFSKSLKFDLEMWHWRDCPARYARTSYWYAKPGSRSHEEAMTPKKLEVVEEPGIQPVKGAIEGENLEYQVTGGDVTKQEGFFELSAGKQLWWTDPKEGDKLTVTVPVEKAGRYEIVGHFCHAHDYGIHTLRFLDKDGKELGPAKTIDFYGTGVAWKKISLGTFDLPQGTVKLEVVSKGHNPQAEPRQMFGLDYLLLNKK